AIAETNRRRKIQEEYNRKHGIVPETIYKTKEEILKTTAFADSRTATYEKKEKLDLFEKLESEERLRALQRAMKQAAKSLEFEKAAAFRDEIKELKKRVGSRR
ncbi:MAG: UvrB/UvrC motif-containing protein, partial [Candidatus Zixiibacteriota bacterium]